MEFLSGFIKQFALPRSEWMTTFARHMLYVSSKCNIASTQD